MPRKGNDNLIPPRTKDEARERGKNGGIASGKSRREKKALRETMEEMLKVALKDDNLLQTYGKLGFAKKGMTMQDAIAAAMIHQAAKGNVKAYQAIKETITEKRDDEQNDGSVTEIVILSEDASEADDETGD